jgi:sugar/nucleoside kinase (ribokinase family)
MSPARRAAWSSSTTPRWAGSSKLGKPTTVSTGGSAANATFNAARLGLRTTFVGKLGNDAMAEAYARRFGAVGVDSSRFKRGTVANARCLAMVTPDAQRTMRTCLGAAMTLSPDEISPEDFRGVKHAHIEGYLVFNEALCDAVLNSAARAAGCTISLDLSSFEVVNAKRDWMFRQFGMASTSSSPTRTRSAPSIRTGRGDYEALARELAGHGVIAAVKMGRDGAWIAKGEEIHRIAPVSCRTSSTPTAPATPGRRASSTATFGDAPRGMRGHRLHHGLRDRAASRDP